MTAALCLPNRGERSSRVESDRVPCRERVLDSSSTTRGPGGNGAEQSTAHLTHVGPSFLPSSQV